MINRNNSLNPASVLCGQKPRGCPRPGGGESADSWESHDRRELHLFRLSGHETPGGTSEAPRQPSHLENKAVSLNLGQQHVLEALAGDPPQTPGDRSVDSDLPDSTGVSKSSSVFRSQNGKREDIISLRKHLGHARRLASAVKRGQSYFHLLQKEEREEREREEKLRTRREEQQRMEPRPPLFSSDSGSDSEGWTVPAGASCSGENEVRPRRKKRQSARPFTPIHHSLASPLLSKAPREVIYRQLCCLNWLLEALTLDGSGKVGPLTACWDPKDPGRGSATMKTLRKERAIENKWEHLVESTQDGLTARLHAHHTSSNSPLTFTTMGSSTLSSLVQHPEEDPVEDPGAAEGTDRPPSECFHTPTHARQRRKKERQKPQTSSVAASLTTPHPSPDKIQDDKSGSKSKARSFRPKSCPAQPPSAISHVISSKASMLQELRAAFDQRAEETAQRYIEVLELKARERLTSGLQRYRALCHMTESHHAPRHVTCESQETEAPTNSYNENKHSNNMWLYSLLSRLPAEVCRERAVSRVLQKLRGFAEQQTTIIVRPHVFLRVLGGLEPWELFLPELCVAIQVALQHVVQMPREKYDVWLQGSLSPHGATLPPTPHTPGEPHSGRAEGKVTGQGE